MSCELVRPRAASGLLRRGPAADCDRDHWHAPGAGPGQLDAVLAHERAHLAYRHRRLLAIARIGSEVLPFVPLTPDMATQVARLIEMYADDVATGTRDGEALATRAGRAGQHRRPGSLRPLPTRCGGYGGCSARPNH
jgi:hypothetical protein